VSHRHHGLHTPVRRALHHAAAYARRYGPSIVRHAQRYAGSRLARRTGKKQGTAEGKVEYDRSFVAGRMSFGKAHFSKMHKMPKFMKYITNPVSITGVGGYKLNSSLDNQAVTCIVEFEFGSMLDLGRAINLARQSATLATAGAVIGEMTNSPFKTYLQYGEWEYSICNGSVFPCDMILYDIVCKRDTNILADASMALDYAPLNTNRDSSQTGNQVLGVYDAMFGPEDSPTFRAFWKITKKTRVVLAPGETHLHRKNVRFDKMLPGALGTSGPGNQICYKGYTSGVLIRQCGFPVAQTLGSNVKLAATELLLTQKWKYVGRGIASPVEHVEYYNNNGSFSGAPQFVNEAQDNIIAGAAGPTYSVIQA